MMGATSVIHTDSNNWAQFNKTPFVFEHPFGTHGLFELSRLRKLAHDIVHRGGLDRVNCLLGEKGPQARWTDWETDGRRLDYCFDHIEEPGQSYVIIYDVETEPEYAAIMNQALREVEAGLGGLQGDKITWPSAYIFIAGPGFSTPYHIDPEIGLLLQMHGEKHMYLLDPRDETLLSQEEIESYYTGNLCAARYDPKKESKAMDFYLTPGKGVIFPIHAPHWVRNGNQYSVSLSINFSFESTDRRSHVYQANHMLRKLGLQPRPPGASPVLDFAKRLPFDVLTPRNPATKDEMMRSGRRRMHSAVDGLRAFVNGVDATLRRPATLLRRGNLRESA